MEYIAQHISFSFALRAFSQFSNTNLILPDSSNTSEQFP